MEQTHPEGSERVSIWTYWFTRNLVNEMSLAAWQMSKESRVCSGINVKMICWRWRTTLGTSIYLGSVNFAKEKTDRFMEWEGQGSETSRKKYRLTHWQGELYCPVKPLPVEQCDLSLNPLKLDCINTHKRTDSRKQVFVFEMMDWMATEVSGSQGDCIPDKSVSLLIHLFCGRILKRGEPLSLSLL